MTKVFVAGGSGRVATALIADLVAAGNDVVAAARHPEKITAGPHITTVGMDLHASVDELKDLMDDCTAVYFVAGSRGKDLLQTDAFGAVKTMQAAKLAGISRYIMLSSMYALQPEEWAKHQALAAITDYNIAKFFADNYLVHQSGLDYTIIQPATLTEDQPTGKVTFGDGADTTNPIGDVAQVLAAVLPRPNTIGKVILMRGGETPIDQALDQL